MEEWEECGKTENEISNCIWMSLKKEVKNIKKKSKRKKIKSKKRKVKQKQKQTVMICLVLIKLYRGKLDKQFLNLILILKRKKRQTF